MADTKIGNQKSAKLSPEPEVITAGAAPALELNESPEEREEALIERENALAAREARLAAMEERVMARLDRLERIQAGEKVEADAELVRDLGPEEFHADGRAKPRFDGARSFGIVYGDPQVAYVQDGHQFSGDRRWVREEKGNKGVGKPFNIKMLGLVKVVRQAA
jgi:hypothetical protein